MIKRTALAITAGLIVATAALASAASLGGLEVSALGADDAVVASCDTDGIDANFSAVYDAASSSYHVDQVTLDAIDAACNGQELSVTLADVDGGELAEHTIAVDDVSMTVDVGPTVAAHTVEHIAVVVTG